jgi:lysozyme
MFSIKTTNGIIDLSHHNLRVDFIAVRRAGIIGVLHKATQGYSYRDPLYSVRQSLAREAGLLWGAYHFGESGDGARQADHFLQYAGAQKHTLLALDLEENPQGPSMSLEEARDFVMHVQAITGRWPGLYGGHILKQLLAKKEDPVLANCWLWLSQYGPAPVVPLNWATWTFWQYTDGVAGPPPHEVAGVGRCDRDQFLGSEDELRAFWRKNAVLWAGETQTDPARA